jgi:hypothetical protein
VRVHCELGCRARLEGTVCCVQDRARLVRALYERLDRLQAALADRTA